MPAEPNDPPWAGRAARNQALFRAINDELRVQGGSGNPETLTIACECADTECVETIEIDFDRYADVRRSPTQFIVLSGHVYPEVERTVAEDGGLVIVEKTGEAGRVALASGADEAWGAAGRGKEPAGA